MSLFHLGYREFVQRSESGPIIATGPCGAQIGPLLGVRSGYADFIALLLHAGGPLAGLHLVLDRTLRRRQWCPVQLVMEAGQRHTITVRLRLVQSEQFTRTGQRAGPQDHVRHGALFHDDLHDERGFRQRRRWNRQRKNIHHLHDDYRMWVSLNTETENWNTLYISYELKKKA